MPRAQVCLSHAATLQPLPLPCAHHSTRERERWLTTESVIVQSQETRYWQWMEEGLNYPAPLVARQLPSCPASARAVDARDERARACNHGGTRVIHSTSLVDDIPTHKHPRERKLEWQAGAGAGGEGAGCLIAGGAAQLLAMLQRSSSIRALRERRFAADANGSSSRGGTSAVANMIRPSSARPSLGSNFTLQAVSSRISSMPVGALPPNLVHASAAAQGGGREGVLVKAGRIPQGTRKKDIKSGAEKGKCAIVSHLAGQLRPRLDPAQRLPPPILRKGVFGVGAYVGLV